MAPCGDPKEISLPQMIESLCLQKQTGQLWVVYPQHTGVFYFQEGELVDAAVGEYFGPEAVYRAMSLTTDTPFEFKSGVVAAQRTIDEPCQRIILQGYCRLKKGEVKKDKHRALTEEQIARSSEIFNQPKLLPQQLILIKGLAFGSWRKVILVSVLIMAVVIGTLAVVSPFSTKHNEDGPSTMRPNSITKNTTAPITPLTSQSDEELAHDSDAIKSSMPQLSPDTSLGNDAEVLRLNESSRSLDISTGYGQSAEFQNLNNSSSVNRREKDGKSTRVETIQPVPTPPKKVDDLPSPVTMGSADNKVDALTSATIDSITQSSAEDGSSPGQAVKTSGTNKVRSEGYAVDVVVKIERGRVSQAYIPRHRQGMEAYEASALRVVRRFRYPPDKTGTETTTIKVNPQNVFGN